MSDLKPWEQFASQNETTQDNTDSKPWEQFGGTTKPEKKGIGGVAKDLAIDLFGVGGNQLAGAGIGLGDLVTHGKFGKAIEENIGYRSNDAVDYWNKQKTEQSQQQAKELGEQKGFVDTAKYMLENPTTIAGAVASSLPTMIVSAKTGGKIAGGMGVSAVAGGAIGEGVAAAGSQADQVRQQSADGLLSNKQIGASIVDGVGTGLISRLSGGLANSKLGQRIGLADADTLFAQSAMRNVDDVGKPIGLKNYAKAIGAGTVTEGLLEEAPQSALDQITQNYALNKDLMEGVGETTAQGLLTGGIMGGGANFARGYTNQQSDTGNPTPTAEENVTPYSQTGVAERIDPDLPQLGYTPPTAPNQLPYQPANDQINVSPDGVAFADENTNDYLQGQQAQDRYNRDQNTPKDINDITPVPEGYDSINDTPALPAPKNDYTVTPNGTTLTPQDFNQSIQDQNQADIDSRNARLRGEVNDITPIPQATPAEQMGLNPEHGALSSAATVAVNTGASPATSDLSQSTQPTQEQPTLTNIAQQSRLSAFALNQENTNQSPHEQVATLWDNQPAENRMAILGEIYGNDSETMAHAEKDFNSLPIPAKRQIQTMAMQSGALQNQTAQTAQTPKLITNDSGQPKLFTNETVAKSFMAKNGMSDTHEIVPTSNNRFAVAEKVQEQPQQPSSKVYGNDSYIQNGSERHPTKVAIMEADELAPDSKDTDNQFRDRTRVASQAQIDSIAGNLDPRQLTDSSTMATGSPTLANDGKTIIAGNGRTQAIKKAYAMGKAEEYRQSVIEQAKQHGIDPSVVAGMKNPVLVKEFAKPVDTKQMAIASNENAGLAMSAKEQARADSERLPDISSLIADDKGDINHVGNSPIIRQFVQSMPVEAQASMMTSNGMLSQEGLKRLQNAVLYKAYGNSKTFDDMVENTDADMKNAIKGLVNIAPKVARVKDGIAQGVNHDADISDEITNALTKLQQIRQNGMSVGDYLAQQGLFEEDLSPVAKQLVAYLDKNIRSAKAITDLLSAYYDNLEALGNPNQSDMFGDQPIADKQSLLNQSMEQANGKSNGQSADFFGQNTANTTPTSAEQQADRPAGKSAIELVRPDQSEGNGNGVGKSPREIQLTPKDEAVKILQGEPVAQINENALDMPKEGGFNAIIQWATNLFAKQGNKATNPILGNITLNERSVRDSLAHGKFNPYKNLAFAGIKNVIEKGVLIAQDVNEFKENSYYISAPVTINGKENIVTVTIHKDSNSQRMYLHGVIIKEGLLTPRVSEAQEQNSRKQNSSLTLAEKSLPKPRVSSTLEKTSRTHTGSLTSADIHNILHDLLAVNNETTGDENLTPSQQKMLEIISNLAENDPKKADYLKQAQEIDNSDTEEGKAERSKLMKEVSTYANVQGKKLKTQEEFEQLGYTVTANHAEVDNTNYEANTTLTAKKGDKSVEVKINKTIVNKRANDNTRDGFFINDGNNEYRLGLNEPDIAQRIDTRASNNEAPFNKDYFTDKRPRLEIGENPTDWQQRMAGQLARLYDNDPALAGFTARANDRSLGGTKKNSLRLDIKRYADEKARTGEALLESEVTDRINDIYHGGQIKYSQMGGESQIIKLKRGDIAVKSELLKDGEKFIDYGYGNEKLSDFINANTALEQYPELGEIKVESAGFFNPLRFDEKTNTLFVPSGMDNKSFEQNVLNLLKEKLTILQKNIKPTKAKVVVDTSNDSEYITLAKRYQAGDISVEPRLRELINQQAATNGFDNDTDFRMNHAAPVNDGFNDSADDISNMFGADIYGDNALHLFGTGEEYASMDRESLQIINRAKGYPERMVPVYRAMPKDAKGTAIGNGDWVTTSKQYAQMHGNNALDGKFKIVSRMIPAKHLYNNGDSIHEWGIDTGEDLLRSKVANREKLNDLVTYDDKGNIIPLSKRFNAKKDDVRYSQNKNQTNTTPEQVQTVLTEKFGKETIDTLLNKGVLQILTAEQAREIDPNLPDSADGFYHNGTATLIADRLNPDMIVPTFLHELGGHGGFQTLLPKSTYQSFMNEFDRLVAEGNSLAVQAKQLADAHSPNQAVANEEYLPYLLSLTSRNQAMQGKVTSLIKRLAMAVRSFLRTQFGVPFKVTANDITALAEKLVGERAAMARMNGENQERQFSQQSEVVNNKFNQELQQLTKGELNGSHIFELGMPNDVLKSTGFPDLPIELKASKLSEKANADWHKFDIADIKDLPKALQNPIAVFRYFGQGRNVITQLEIGGKQLLVGIHFNQKSNGIEINDIRGLFPKDNHEWLNWITQKDKNGDDKLLYADKQKIQTLINQQRTNLAEVEYLDLDLVESILQNHQNVNNQYSQQTPQNDDIRYSQLGDINSIHPQVRGVANVLSDFLKNPLSFSKTGANNKITDHLGKALAMLGRRQIVEIYNKDIPALKEYSDIVEQMDTDANETAFAADQLVNKWSKLTKPEQAKLAEVMHDSTLRGIDPSKPHQAGDDRNHYQRLKDKYYTLTPEAKEIFTQARDDYKNHQKEVYEAVKGRIERSKLSPTKQRELIANLKNTLVNDKVYFPLTQFGKYVVAVKNSQGEIISVSRAETLAQAESLRKELQKNHPNDKVQPVMLEKELVNNQGGITNGFMKDLYDEINNMGINDQQAMEFRDTLGNLYLNSLPDLTFSDSRIYRNGIGGFSQNARRAYAQHMSRGGKYVAKMRHADILQAKLEQMQEHVTNQANSNDDYDQPKMQRVVDEMEKRHENLMNPQSHPTSSFLTGVGFLWYMGLSPASAIVNLSQTALVAYPVMGAKWGFNKSSKALLELSALTAKNKNDLANVLKGNEKKAFDEAVRRGVIDLTQAHDLAGVANGEDEGVMWKMQPVMRMASFMFHHAEKFNRQVTYVAAYRLAVEAGSTHEQAIEQAIDATYEGHFSYASSNRPRLMQGNWQKVIFLFKQFAQNMVYTLARNAYLSIMADTKADEIQARKALAGILTMHGLFAGALGLPMVSTLLAFASAVGGDDDEPWDAEIALRNWLAEMLGDDVSEVISKGLPRAIGMDLSTRVGLDSLILPRMQDGLEGQRMGENLLAGLSGPVAGIGVNTAKGLGDIANGDYVRGAETMLPKVLKDLLKTYRINHEGVKDKSGIEIVAQENIGLSDIGQQIIGFRSEKIAQAQEVKSAIYQMDKKLTKRRQELIDDFARAKMAGDEDKADEAWQDIKQFNETNGEKFPKLRVTKISLLKSVRDRQNRINQAKDGIYLPKTRQAIREYGAFGME